jgi:hypothetical protein
MTSPPEPALIRVLGFTSSRHQPLLLRHCMLQMHNQSHPLEHAIFVNSSEPDNPYLTSLRYDTLLDDAAEDAARRTFLGYGPSATSHQNHALALSMVELDDYQLFLKIDDSDIYLSGYVEGVVRDFVANGWDYSGTHSHGVVKDGRWSPNVIVDYRGGGTEAPGAPLVMPATAAFSRRAIEAFLGTADTDRAEDQPWGAAINRAGLSMMLRHDDNYIYNEHDDTLPAAPRRAP